MHNHTIVDNLARLHEHHFGARPTLITELKGDGSDRRIYRVFADANESLIGIYGANRRENEAFVSFSNTFYQHSIPVPVIFAYNADAQVYLESDLGDVTLLEWGNRHSDDDSGALQTMYQQVISWLPEIQIRSKDSIDYDKCYQFAAFRREAMQFDLHYFQASFLTRFLRSRLNDAALADDFNVLISHLLPAPYDAFMYRDFQSKNIMIVDGQPFFIDYQSGRKGAPQYDIASLLFDANVTLSHSFREEMLEFYLSETSRYIQLEQFRAFYYNFALLRMLQALAAFSFLVFEKGKSHFMTTIPNALQNIAFLLSHDGCILSALPELRRLFEEDILINDQLTSAQALS
ncbi:phosphotransferase [candidate division KSB1 bacterium]|nr:phosphotransferase [candidate division KSB1 bacterium]